MGKKRTCFGNPDEFRDPGPRPHAHRTQCNDYICDLVDACRYAATGEPVQFGKPRPLKQVLGWPSLPPEPII